MSKENYLQSENVLEMESILGFTPFFDTMSGTLEWSSNESPLFIYATPNWETEGSCPVEYYSDEDSQRIEVGVIDFVGKSMEEQIKEYRELISDIIRIDNYVRN
jgi:hypothetical protein